MNEGYIYILQNASLAETHLKIGRTTVHPNSRASELSRATGIPTPFVVVWYSETCDCFLAERILHEMLAKYRTNPKREFFAIELSQAIEFAEHAVDRAGRHAPSTSPVGVPGRIVSSIFSSGWKVVAFVFTVLGYTILFCLKLCAVLAVTLPLAFISGILSGLAKPPRRRRKNRPWWV